MKNKMIWAILLGMASILPVDAEDNYDIEGSSYSNEENCDCEDYYFEDHCHCYWEDESESELGADWPGKRTDPFYDNLTR